MARPTWLSDGSEIPDPLGYGERAVRFLKALKHPKSTLPGQAFQLDPWQERIIRRIYGPRHPDGTRIVKSVILLLPRGNRKTSLSAALALLHTVGPERIPGGEVISAASDRKQARIAYEEALGIVRATAPIAEVVRPQDYRNKLVSTKWRSFYESISSEAGVQHGRTPTFVLADELHAWPRRDLWDVLRSGLVKVPGSLMVVATTAGKGTENIAFQIVDDARKIARGEAEDPSILPVLFEADPDCDWQDEAVWRDVNPGLEHGYPDIEGLRQLAREAERRPGDREAFRQLNLNIWSDYSSTPFVDVETYDLGKVPVDAERLKGRTCWLGVDMAATTDLSAIVAAFPDGDDGFDVLAWFFVPEDRLQARAERDRVPYPQWASQGYIIPTGGTVVDYHAIAEHIRHLCEIYDVAEIACDPAYSRPVTVPLMDHGLPVVEFRQGWVSMAPAVKTLERAIQSAKFRHGGHPVLRWCFLNIAVHTDSAGNALFHKGKSRDRIDGAVAAAMAVQRASQGNAGRSVYETGLRPEGLFLLDLEALDG